LARKYGLTLDPSAFARGLEEGNALEVTAVNNGQQPWTPPDEILRSSITAPLSAHGSPLRVRSYGKSAGTCARETILAGNPLGERRDDRFPIERDTMVFGDQGHNLGGYTTRFEVEVPNLRFAYLGRHMAALFR